MKCVRCLNDSADLAARATDGSGAWEIYLCNCCNYSWRSTEDEDITNIEKRDPYFQLDKVDLEKVEVGNPIAPLARQVD